MKPTKLTIKGLNSFSEEQAIDFNRLSEKGLFGIFGPTGSGKSTVLDAITFALYGRIARESGAKTSSDVINIHEKTARVIFEFDVNGKSPQSYKIVREIKRKEPSGILTTQIKIYETSGAEEVILAEKEKEFNAVIAKVIGLEYEDFVKTVVLPQGGFNDFLKMEGKDRRIVLERLFNLEKYGEDLFRKISSKYADKNGEKIALEGELKAYEDLSENGLKEEAQALKNLAQDQEELGKEREKDNQALEKAKQGYEIQEELRQKKSLLEEEQKKTPQIEAIREQIKNSRKYQMVESQIIDYKKLLQAGREVADQLKQAEKASKQAQEAQKTLAESFQKLEEEKNTRYPELLKRQSQLESSVESYQSYQQNLKHQKSIEASMMQVGKNWENTEKNLQGILEEKNRYAEAQVRLKNQIEALQNSQDRMESLGKAIAIMGKIDTLKDQRSKLEDQARALYQACENLVEGIDQLQELEDKKLEIAAIQLTLENMAADLDALGLGQGEDPKKILEKLAAADEKAEALTQDLKGVEENIRKKDKEIEDQKTSLLEIKIQASKLETEQDQHKKVLSKEKEALEKLLGQVADPSQELRKTSQEIQGILEGYEKLAKDRLESEENLQKLQTQVEILKNRRLALVDQVKEVQSTLYEKLEEEEVFLFSQVDSNDRNKYLQEYIPLLESWKFSKVQIEEKEKTIADHYRLIDEGTGLVRSLSLKVGDKTLDKASYEEILARNRAINRKFEEVNKQIAARQAQYENNLKRFDHVKILKKKLGEIHKVLGLLNELRTLLSGRKFVEFMAINQLKYVTIEATKMLDDITGGDYSLEVDAFGSFKIRDNKNGGMLRNVKSLSGGETFLVSLSLALALSSQIQLKGVAPLELFFLDEGFGTLDDDLLDTVVEALNSVKHDKLKIGLISHVEQLKQRIPVRLSVSPAQSGQGGSKIAIEYN